MPPDSSRDNVAAYLKVEAGQQGVGFFDASVSWRLM